MKQNLMTALLAMACSTAMGQPRYDYEQLSTDFLNRGVVAVRQADGRVAVSWRTLRTDQKGEPFDIYRNGEKLNPQPLAEGGTFFVDENPVAGEATYEVRGGQATGSFTLAANAPQGYLPLKLDKPEGGRTPDGRQYTYSANDASVGDVDGDGQYELFVKWEPSNAHDNSQGGFSGPVLIDCYRLSGERLWRIDLGRNIRAGAHYTQFIVYDFDGDGRAELMVKTADGTTDGAGTVIGDSVADYRVGAKEALAQLTDGRNPEVEKQDEEMRKARQQWQEQLRSGQRPDRRDMTRRMRQNNRGTNRLQGRILDGPEYISVFDGATGRVLDTKPYIPERGQVSAWGDDYGNRSERYVAGVGYLGGTTASGIFCRGYYTRTVIAAWDWDGKELKNRWTFDTNQTEWQSYAGQGNHNIRIADVDGDGYDEITYGSMAVDNDGRGLYNTGFGHGDAIHLMAFDPATDRLQVWDCHENKRDGSDFRDAATGEVIFQIKSNTDVGRAMAADIDPTNPGVEMWSTDSHGIRNMKGDLVKRGNGSEEDNTKLVIKGKYLPVNFGIWWDGDLLRELLDHETVYKYNWEEASVDVVEKFAGSVFNNGTKSNPCLQADILGDWREEVIARDRESTELRIYVSTVPTAYRINCLMQDIPYRLSVAYQNVGYNQPPEPGFYLGPDRTDYLK